MSTAPGGKPSGVFRLTLRRLTLRGVAYRPTPRALGWSIVAIASGPPEHRARCVIATCGYAALRLIWPSASLVSLLSVAFSSSSVCWSTLAQSARPICFAHATSVP
jgi:hypothetical protein